MSFLLLALMVLCGTGLRGDEPKPERRRVEELFAAREAKSAAAAYARLTSEFPDAFVVDQAYALVLTKRVRPQEAITTLRRSIFDTRTFARPNWVLLVRSHVLTDVPASTVIDDLTRLSARLMDSDLSSPDERVSVAEFLGRCVATGQTLSDSKDAAAWDIFHQHLQESLPLELIDGYEQGRLFVRRRHDELEQSLTAAKQASTAQLAAQQQALAKSTGAAITRREDELVRLKQESSQQQSRVTADLEQRRGEVAKLEARYLELEPDRQRLTNQRSLIVQRMDQLRQVGGAGYTISNSPGSGGTLASQGVQAQRRQMETEIAVIDKGLEKIFQQQQALSVAAQNHVQEMQKALNDATVSDAERARLSQELARSANQLRIERKTSEKMNAKQAAAKSRDIERQLEDWDTYLEFDWKAAKEDLLARLN